MSESKPAGYVTFGLIVILTAVVCVPSAHAYNDSRGRGFSDRRIELPNQRPREVGARQSGRSTQNPRIEKLRDKTARAVSGILVRR